MGPRIPSRPQPPLSYLIAILGLVASAGLSFIAFVPTIFTEFDPEAPQASVLIFTLASILGVGPAVGATWVLWCGYKWAPIAVTLAALWGAILVLGSDDVVSWLSLAVAGIAAVAVWMSPTKRFSKELRESRSGSVDGQIG